MRKGEDLCVPVIPVNHSDICKKTNVIILVLGEVFPEGAMAFEWLYMRYC